MRSHAVCLQTSHRLQQEMEAEVQRANTRVDRHHRSQ